MKSVGGAAAVAATQGLNEFKWESVSVFDVLCVFASLGTWHQLPPLAFGFVTL